ncbi:hypothetical protein B0H14DRAFT_3448075 [Mycena olivaceomarginata]|nr:hypothetical protein B0H14DRAFT_3448075 [Mycena olivaceomarginata]
MPSAVHKIDENSPLVQYAGPWDLGGADDPEANRYNQGTFLHCTGTQCSATISFTGTEVHVVGALRNTSGPYQVNLDGQVFGPFVTQRPVVEQFQIDLFNQTNLLPGAHNLTISAAAPVATPGPIHLDYFTWISDVNSQVDIRVQDDASAFVYEPPTAWFTFTDRDITFPGFDGGGQRVGTTLGGANVTLSFTGDRVGLYGSIGVQGGPYTVRVDNGSVSNFTSKRRIADPNTSLADYLAGQMLFYTDGLVAGNHTLTVTSNLGSLGIDYAIIDGTLKPSPTNPSNPAGKSGSTRSPKTGLSPSETGGIVAGTAVLVLALVGALVYVVIRRRRSHQQTQVSSLTITSFPHAGYPSPAGSSLIPPRRQGPLKSLRNEVQRQVTQLDPPEYYSVETGDGRH